MYLVGNRTGALERARLVRTFSRRTLAFLGAIFALAVAAFTASAAGDEVKDFEFFEKKIRPVLAAQCYGCHSVEAQERKKLKGGLLIDSKSGLLQGGDSGPALVPGNVDESLLIEVLRYDDAIQMPPRGKLPDEVIADFETWVRMGAPDPRTATTLAKPSAPSSDPDAGRKHWAYRPPREAAPPVVKDADWCASEIDRFILARLEAEGLHPAAEADRATLCRRLYFDLTGLPPSPEELDTFLADRSPTAYEKLVDRLLASPHFGERWGRHWLDVVRFAESLTLRGFIFKEAWRYRDYVIEAFNNDLPYDQFLREQIAGDLLPAQSLDQQRRQLVALTFLTLGNTNLEEQDKAQLRMDVVDEQLDTIGKAMLAQTIGCARCHDHKFDPIPTKDYYAMAGILRNAKAMEHANVSKWLERPLPVEPEREAELKAHEQAIAAIERRIKTERARLAKGTASAAGVIASKDLPGVVVDDSQARRVGEWKESQYSGSYIGTGYLHDNNTGKGEKTLTFQPDLPEAGEYEIWLAYSHGGSRSSDVPVTIFSADGEKVVPVDMRPVPPIEGRFVSLGRYHFERNGQGFVMISNEGTTGHVTADAVLFLTLDQANRKPANAAATSSGPSKASELRELEAELKALRAGGPAREMVMTVFEESDITDTRVHVRGLVHSLGEPAPRGVLRVATIGEAPAMPSRESGRRELADWIASPSNPLTARVIVNRAWHWLFGAGVVRTTDNFGTTGETPSHPELLDALTIQFVADGWSIKSLVRRIALSRTYRLSSSSDERALARDPENRWLCRANRRRLDAECLRDAILSVSGRLSLETGGPSFSEDRSADYGFKYEGLRRSVYAPVFRNALPELFEVFDFADPSMVVGRRDVSTVASQALFLMNSPFVQNEAEHAARRLLAEPDLDDRGRLDRAYRLALGRPPTEEERRVGLSFVGQGAESDAEDRWAAMFKALFGSLDFRYVR